MSSPSEEKYDDSAGGKDQWIDPCMLLIGQGNVEWARWATAWLYENICAKDKPSHDWPKYGYIDQFDRSLSFNLPNATPVQDQFLTNNRNWLLISRSAVARETSTNVQLDLSNFQVSLQIPPTTTIIEPQPATLVFGSGELPNYRFYPERWFANVTRTFRLTNNSGTPANVDLSCMFLMVRTN